jgi:hypothetical protein
LEVGVTNGGICERHDGISIELVAVFFSGMSYLKKPQPLYLMGIVLTLTVCYIKNDAHTVKYEGMPIDFIETPGNKKSP